MTETHETHEAYIIQYNQEFRPAPTYWTGDSFNTDLNKARRYTLNQSVSEFYTVLESFNENAQARLKIIKCAFTMTPVKIEITMTE